MPRSKRKSATGRNNIGKRWCPSVEVNSNSDFSLNTSVRCLKLEEASSSSTRSQQVYNDGAKSPTYIIIDTVALEDLFKNNLCIACKNGGLRVVYERPHGFCHSLKVVCDFCDEAITEVKTSKNITNENGTMQAFDINLRATKAFLSVGRGYTALEKFCMLMNIHLMSSRTFNLYKKILHSSLSRATNKQFEQIRNDIKKAYNEEVNGITNIAVTFDGTWLTRGHTSQIGIGCVIDMLTGYVVDFQVMSKYCKECELAKNKLNKSSKEFEIWYEEHKDSCSINHSGSSGSMEVQAASKLWSRSEKIGFRYTSVLSDGDSKAFQYITEARIYGDVKIKKEECVNHVSKRLGTALRNCVKEWRSRGVTLGGKSHGSLKDETIKKLTRYYQNAILKNKGDASKMKTAIFATLFHSISTDKKPQHSKCPPGPESWCFYQAAVASGKKPGLHKELVRTPVKEAHLAKILPIYQRLASDELLERCIRCMTQNSNESLHNVIWSKCSKISSASTKRVYIAVCEAVSEFNVGTLKTLELLQNESNMKLNISSRNLAMYKDYRRVYFRKRRKLTLYNLVQKKIKLARKRREMLIRKKEGITYKAGHF